MQLTQHNRLLNINTPLGKDALILTKLNGHEQLSSPFHFALTCITQQKNLDTSKMLNQNISIEIHEKKQQTRYIHGCVAKVQTGAVDYAGFQSYRLDIVPNLWFLKLSSHCRIFQQESVVDIIKSILKSHNIHNLDVSQLKQTYEPLNFCVQYNESDLAFISRILEDAGIYYYFEFTKDDYTLVVIDQLQQLPNDTQSTVMSNIKHHGPHLHRWQKQESYASSQLSSRDYNFQTPDTRLDVNADRAAPLAAVEGANDFEAFHYPGNYPTKAKGQPIIDRAMQVQTWQANTIKAEGNYAHFYAGLLFNLSEHDNGGESGQYYITAITHKAHDQSHLNEANEDQDQLPQYYENKLTCVSEQHPFAPPKLTPRPNILGAQTAKVVGSAGKDLYTDPYGRVKVQFHWDRLGKDDEHSSCWLRVSQLMNGSGFGTQMIPRIGQEVTVKFMNGNPDQPIITGTAYNGDNQIPYSLPDNKTQSGIKTHTLGSDGNGEYNGIQFEDKAGQEAFNVHAQRDMIIQALNDCTEIIGNGESITIDQQKLMQVLNGQIDIDANAITLAVGQSSIVIDQAGVTINSPKVNKLSEGAGPMMPIARLGDKHQCHKIHNLIPHGSGSILNGSGNVTVNNLPLARQGDSAHCRVENDSVKQGTASLLVNGLPAGKMGDKMAHGGMITQGSPNVFSGDRTPVSFTPPPATVSHKPSHDCFIKDVTIKCGHDKRSYKMKVSDGKPTLNEQYIFEVIATDTKPDTVSIDFSGRCNNPNPPKNGKHCPAFEVFHDGEASKPHLGPGSIKVYSIPTSPRKDFGEFFNSILIPKSLPNSYTIKALTCNPNDVDEVIVNAYAPVEWNGHISLGSSIETKKMDDGSYKFSHKPKWTFENEISVKRNNDEWKLGKSTETSDFFKGMQTFANKLIPTLGVLNKYASGKFKFEVDLPKLSLGGSIKNQEDESGYKVNTVGNISLGLDPLFGLTGQVDVVQWIIDIFPATKAAKFLYDILKKCHKDDDDEEKDTKIGASAEISLVLEASAQISGKVNWEKVQGEQWKTKGDVVGSLPISIQGHAGFKVKVFEFIAASGVDICISSGIDMKLTAQAVNNHPAVLPQLGFNGLTVYWAAYAEFGTNRHKNNKSTIPPGAKSSDNKMKINKKKIHHSVLIKETIWPEKPTPILLNSGEL